MSDPTDDEALTWEGDDRLRAPVGPAPRLVDDDPVAVGTGGGSFGLLALGVLGGVAAIEAVFWFRSITLLSIAATVSPGAGTAPEVAAFAINLAFRVLAVAAPLVWYAIVAVRVRPASRRLAMLLLGAVLLVPWPALLGAAT